MGKKGMETKPPKVSIRKGKVKPTSLWGLIKRSCSGSKLNLIGKESSMAFCLRFQFSIQENVLMGLNISLIFLGKLRLSPFFFFFFFLYKHKLQVNFIISFQMYISNAERIQEYRPWRCLGTGTLRHHNRPVHPPVGLRVYFLGLVYLLRLLLLLPMKAQTATLDHGFTPQSSFHLWQIFLKPQHSVPLKYII